MSKQWTICLDYDGTIFEGHTNGLNQKQKPMNSENEMWFKSMLEKWQNAGHYVAIVTRGVRDNMADYIAGIKIDCVNVSPETEITDNKKLYIYGADDYNDMRDATMWSKRKVDIVGEFIKAVGGSDERMVFADDTMINLDAMRKAYPHDNIVNAGKKGDYKAMFREVDDIVDKSTPKEKRDGFFLKLQTKCKQKRICSITARKHRPKQTQKRRHKTKN